MRERFFKFFILLGTLCIMGVGFLGLILTYVSYDMPDVKELMNYSPPMASQILSREGDVLFTIGSEKRDLADMSEVPKMLVEAFLSSEDNNFFNHKGVDYLGISRALVADIKAGKIVQGGSTITQQVAKMILLTREKSVLRKIKDFVLAQRIEKVFSKEEILYFYLNHIYLGGGYYGVKTAFKGYFNKEMKQGTIAEYALIAGLIVAPGRYSPNNNPQFAKMRQKYVLGRMLDDKKITAEQYNEALAENLKIRLSKPADVKAGHFIDWIRQTLEKEIGEEELERGGMKIVTTLDWDLQKKAEEEILKGAKNIDKRQGFNGPLKHLEDEDQITEVKSKMTSKLVQLYSKYFVLTPEGEKIFELDYLDKQLNSNNAQSKNIFNKDAEFYEQDDNSVNYELEIGKNHEAIVEKVSDKQKIVYISMGEVSCIIPKENYMWAHPRVKDGKNSNLDPVEIPSKILRRGDIVLAKVLSPPKPLWNYLSNDYRKTIKDSEKMNYLKNFKVHICDLDQDPEIESSLVAINPNSGEILSMVGGLDFYKSQFNRAIQSQRQPGSSFKPIIYAAALENKFTPATIVYDSPEALAGVDENSKWKPKNYDGTFKGAMTFRRALEQSRNIPTIRIAEEIGLKKINQFMKRIGLKTDMGTDLSLALGSFGVTLLDLVATYAMFPNGGKKVSPYAIVSIKDKNDKDYDSSLSKKKVSTEEKIETNTDVVTSDDSNNEKKNYFTNDLRGNQVYDSRLAYIMTNLLRGVILHGTGKAARDIGTYIAGKTGTSNDNIDAWFVGFSSNVAMGIWTGFDDNRPLGGRESGSIAALPIWKQVMSFALSKYGDSEFRIPEGIINVQINYETGKLIQDASTSPDLILTEAFVSGTEPGSERKVRPGEEDNSQFKDVFDEDDFYQNQ